MKRTSCHKGHALEPKTVPASLLGSLGFLKHCKRCHAELKQGHIRFSCKPCDLHFCPACFALPVCPHNHTLESKLSTGGWFSVPKSCMQCAKSMPKGALRYSCKPCNYHLCETCWHSIADSGKKPAAGAPAPKPPLAPAAPSVPSAPPAPPAPPPETKRRACKYGSQCYQKSSAHLERFVHPGDRNYRIGLVLFEGNTAPDFDSLWQFFQYHDPDESGHISKAEFGEVINSLSALSPQSWPESLDSAWELAGGPLHGYVNFRQFVSWTQHLGVEYPLGLEEATAASVCRPCRFRLPGGTRCSCPCFEATEVEGLCKCGHKASMHRSDLAERTFTEFLESSGNVNWEPDKEGLVEIADEDLLGKLQDLLTASHKTTHNWTRDRGCKLHGVNGCSAACSSKNRKTVPTGYTLVTAFRNQNADLWQKYSLVKTAILEECSRGSTDVTMEARSVVTSGKILDSPLDDAFNEWYLFHGSSSAKCKSICSSNFRLNLAGSGATWKDPGSDVGVPLYGYGIYLAEHVTKADEYSEAIPADETFLPVLEEHEFYTVLLCRVLGGRTNVVTTNEIEREKLKADVFAGPFHSVFGDRVVTLGKPFREVVVYDKDQCYPEFLLVYARRFDG